MPSAKKVSVTVVVSGKDTAVEIPEDSPLSAVIPKALEQTGNSGRPPQDWELKDAQGNILDLDKRVGDYNFSKETPIFLSLKAGVGGNA